MPHPRPDDLLDLPEYPVGRRAPGRRPVTVWERFPLGSRLGAIVVVTLFAGIVLSFVRGDGDASAAQNLALDPAAESVDGGLAPDPPSVAPSPAPFLEGPLPMVEGPLPPTLGTPAPAPAVAAVAGRPSANAAAQATAPAVVKPAAPATTAAKRSTTAAPAVVKPAPSTTKATAPRQAVVKPPTTATTPRTTRAPAATTVPAKTSYTTDEVQALIRQMWPADSVDKALDVAYRESRYRATAYNGWCCYGVFQINASAHQSRIRARGLVTADLYDARVNVEIAIEIYQQSGWGPWGG